MHSSCVSVILSLLVAQGLAAALPVENLEGAEQAPVDPVSVGRQPASQPQSHALDFSSSSSRFKRDQVDPSSVSRQPLTGSSPGALDVNSTHNQRRDEIEANDVLRQSNPPSGDRVLDLGDSDIRARDLDSIAGDPGRGSELEALDLREGFNRGQLDQGSRSRQLLSTFRGGSLDLGALQKRQAAPSASTDTAASAATPTASPRASSEILSLPDLYQTKTAECKDLPPAYITGSVQPIPYLLYCNATVTYVGVLLQFNNLPISACLEICGAQLTCAGVSVNHAARSCTLFQTRIDAGKPASDPNYDVALRTVWKDGAVQGLPPTQ